jgi:ABC-type Zn uptake system ZnuABC Zn-binding protein ZnuA
LRSPTRLARLPRGIGFAALTVLAAVLAVGCGEAGPGTGPRAAADTTDATARVAAFTCPPSARDAGGPRPGPAAGGRLQVVTTVAPITSIVGTVAGDRADVVGVIPEGQDSHTYEPKPSVARVVSSADVVFVNGLKLEDPTRRLAQENAPRGAQIVELGSLTVSPDQYLYDFSFPKDAGKPNPHLWTNPPMAACYAEIAASVMGKADPANANAYRANAERLVSRIDDLDQRMRAATATLPPEHRKLLTYHDAYAYFAAHYGWQVIGAIQLSSFEDPTPKEVARLIEQVKAQKVPAIFGSEVFPSPVLAQIGKETGTRYVDSLRDDDLPGDPGDADHSYLGLMKFDFVTMVTNLGGDASGLQEFGGPVAPDHAEYAQ